MNKGEKKFDKITTLKWTVVSILFLCALIVLKISTVSYGKYYNEFKGNKSANIAVMATDVTVEYLVNDLNLYPGAEMSLLVNITNTKNGTVAEINQQYTVEVETTNNLPLTIKFFNSDNQEVQPQGQFTAGIEQLHKYTIKIYWDSNDNNYDYAYEIDVIRILVHSIQIGG